jgi:Uma2 family endonuclease
MAGASADHNRISGNIFHEVKLGLRGQDCEPFMADMKVKVPPQGGTHVFYYPDVFVACDRSDDARYFRERPVVIFEVLSPDTARTDEREKVIAYCQIPTLQAYLLVDQDRVRVTGLFRTSTGWRTEVFEGAEAVLKLDALGLEIPLARLYERTAAAQAPRV